MNVLSKVPSLQCFKIKQLYGNSPHPWKIIPVYFKFQKKVKFHSNLGVPANKIKRFPM